MKVWPSLTRPSRAWTNSERVAATSASIFLTPVPVLSRDLHGLRDQQALHNLHLRALGVECLRDMLTIHGRAGRPAPCWQKRLAWTPTISMQTGCSPIIERHRRMAVATANSAGQGPLALSAPNNFIRSFRLVSASRLIPTSTYYELPLLQDSGAGQTAAGLPPLRPGAPGCLAPLVQVLPERVYVQRFAPVTFAAGPSLPSRDGQAERTFLGSRHSRLASRTQPVRFSRPARTAGISADDRALHRPCASVVNAEPASDILGN